jgi:hypothetical protein
MAKYVKGTKIKLEIEGTVTDRQYSQNLIAVPSLNGGDTLYLEYAPGFVMRVHNLGSPVRPNQVWQKDGKRYYVREGFTDPDHVFMQERGIDLISFETNRRAWHIPAGVARSLEDDGFELVLDVEEDGR